MATNTHAIRGVTRSALWNSWKEVRQQLKRAPYRDVLDFLEYDIDPNVWMRRLLRQLAEGTYTPQNPKRLVLAKSKGFDRLITLPAIPDLVLYRTIVDHLFRLAQKRQKKHVYFSRSTLSKVVKEATEEAKFRISIARDAGAYSRSAFFEWLKYDQYRKLLIFDRVYPYIVVTDVTNFFDSVLYGRIEESLHELSAPTRMVSLLFKLLEALSVREPYAPVQRIGLPVDPCDCSRNLAHMALFPHDERIAAVVGEDAYVRWMDDQNIGVETRADGLKVLSEVGSSLRRLHFTPNAGKSKILSLEEAKKHFHFESNKALDSIEELAANTNAQRKILRLKLKTLWKSASQYESVGEWEKILKRIYRHCARAQSKLLRKRAHADIVRSPGLTGRVADYMRYVLTVPEYINFVETVLSDPEQIYPNVGYDLIESLLLLDPEKEEKIRLRKIAQGIMQEKVVFPGSLSAKVLVPLFYLRYGDKRNVMGLAGSLGRKLDKLPEDQVRATCSVLAGYGAADFQLVKDAASRLLRNHLSEFVLMVERIIEFKTVPGRFKHRIRQSRDSITGKPYLEMRSLLAARLLGLAQEKDVKKWLNLKKHSIQEGLGKFDQKLVQRLWP